MFNSWPVSRSHSRSSMLRDAVTMLFLPGRDGEDAAGLDDTEGSPFVILAQMRPVPVSQTLISLSIPREIRRVSPRQKIKALVAPAWP